jgi:hypothetical protein
VWFAWGAENDEIEVPKKVPKLVDTDMHLPDEAVDVFKEAIRLQFVIYASRLRQERNQSSGSWFAGDFLVEPFLLIDDFCFLSLSVSFFFRFEGVCFVLACMVPNLGIHLLT